jgi:hypothetical protein
MGTEVFFPSSQQPITEWNPEPAEFNKHLFAFLLMSLLFFGEFMPTSSKLTKPA